MPYTYSTFAQAKQQLANRLDNPDKQFWQDIELGTYIIEALRTWNAHTNFWRGEFVLDLTQNVTWYDITDPAIAPNTLRPRTVTDADLYRAIEYAFLEPATGVTWTGSLQFTVDDLINAVQRKQNETLSNTTCHVVRTLVPAIPGRTYISDRTLDIRRVAWLPNTSQTAYTNTPLWPDDRFALESYEHDYTVQIPGTPSTYRRSTEPPLAFDADIPPAVPGDYEVLSVNASASFSTDPDAATVLLVPDDFTWVVKYGAMADLLNREANAKDPLRAQYCQSRYAMGCALLSQSSAVLNTRIGNIPVWVDSVQNTDNYRPNWQAETPGAPDSVAIAGLNLLGFVVTPGAGPYSSTLTVVRNAPIPATDADYIQLGQDDYDAVLDYAQHIAAFKMGGAEFIVTLPLLQRFFKQASMYNSKLLAMGAYTQAIYAMSNSQSKTNPVFATVDSTTSDTQPAVQGGVNG